MHTRDVAILMTSVEPLMEIPMERVMTSPVQQSMSSPVYKVQVMPCPKEPLMTSSVASQVQQLMPSPVEPMVPGSVEQCTPDQVESLIADSGELLMSSPPPRLMSSRMTMESDDSLATPDQQGTMKPQTCDATSPLNMPINEGPGLTEEESVEPSERHPFICPQDNNNTTKPHLHHHAYGGKSKVYHKKVDCERGDAMIHMPEMRREYRDAMATAPDVKDEILEYTDADVLENTDKPKPKAKKKKSISFPLRKMSAWILNDGDQTPLNTPDAGSTSILDNRGREYKNRVKSNALVSGHFPDNTCIYICMLIVKMFIFA